MKRIKQQSQFCSFLFCAGNIVLVLVLMFAANNVIAQQSAPANANQSQSQAAAGSPTMGFRAQTVAISAKPAVQVASAPSGLHIDPITGAPISTLASRPISVDGATQEEASNDVGVLASPGSIHQGLTVHGHWVINVSNPDGTQVQHHEFENSLEGSAQPFLVGLLTGYLVPGDWMIVAGAQTGNAACLGTYQFCGFVQSTATYPALGYCGTYYCTGSTLTVTPNLGTGGFTTGPFSLVLSGTITANQTGTIGNVYTLLNTCANIAYTGNANPSSLETGSPASCAAQTNANPIPWYGPFTDANITPVSVTSGQIVQVIVTITFS